MQDFLLLVPILAVFIFGWFLMKKLDAFLNENRKVQAGQLERDTPEFSVFLFHGDEEDLLEKLALHKLDIVFLPEQVDIPTDKEYNRKKVILESNLVLMKYGGLPIENCNFDDRRESDGTAKTESG